MNTEFFWKYATLKNARRYDRIGIPPPQMPQT
jgi:hypothetical protein